MKYDLGERLSEFSIDIIELEAILKELTSLCGAESETF